MLCRSLQLDLLEKRIPREARLFRSALNRFNFCLSQSSSITSALSALTSLRRRRGAVFQAGSLDGHLTHVLLLQLAPEHLHGLWAVRIWKTPQNPGENKGFQKPVRRLWQRRRAWRVRKPRPSRPSPPSPSLPLKPGHGTCRTLWTPRRGASPPTSHAHDRPGSRWSGLDRTRTGLPNRSLLLTARQGRPKDQVHTAKPRFDIYKAKMATAPHCPPSCSVSDDCSAGGSVPGRASHICHIGPPDAESCRCCGRSVCMSHCSSIRGSVLQSRRPTSGIEEEDLQTTPL